MKYLKLIMVFCAAMVFFPRVSPAQNTAMIDDQAIVVDPGNEPIEGGLDEISVEMDADMVHLPFRKVKRRDLLGGVSVVQGPDLLRKNYTTNPIDGLNTLLGGFNGNSIWGMEGYLIVVDGIPRDVENFRTTEIEQITVLKGAGAVALYGTHAANGVIFITTKRGMVSEQRIDVRVNSGMYMPKRYPGYLNSAEYMAFYNEARLNDGLGHLYTQNDIANSASGSNKYRYPDMDFYSSEFLKNTYNRSDITTEIYGGDNNARYYTNIGYMRQGSLLNFGEGANSFDHRFNLRGNVDVDLTAWLSASVDAGAIFAEGRGPQTNFWEQAAIVRPNRFSPLIPISMIDMGNDANRIYVENTDNLIDGSFILGGTQLDLTNPFADVYSGGYNKAVNRQFMFNTNFDADLSGILQGLAFRSKVGIDYNTVYNQGYNHEYQVFQPQWVTVDGTDLIESLTPWGQDDKSNVQYVGNSWYQQLIYFSGQLDYRKTFNGRHNLFTMLIANGYQYSVSGEYHKTNNSNLGYYAGYNYLNKYYIDFNGSLMYTTKLAPGNRFAFSPVVTLGWRLSDESFMQGLTFVDDLKITSTLGRIYSDLNIEQYYMYTARYNYRGTNWYSWAADMGIDVTAALRGANPDLEAPRRDEISLGFEASLANRKIDLEAGYFSNTHTGGIIQATTLFPNYLMTGWPESSFLPYVNYNEERRSGFDFNLRYNKKSGNVAWTLGIAGMYYDTKILKRADIYEFDYQEREGRPIDGIWGLQSTGFFADQADISNSPNQAFGQTMPGDLKYVDQNGDGVIDGNDLVYLGKGGWWGAPYTIGINLTANWRNITFYAQGIGRWGSDGIKNRTTDWVFGDRKYSDVVYDRWAYYTDPVSGETVDTRATATYPRLTTQSGDNNFRNSDFWLFSTNRFDLAKIQITYRLPNNMLGNVFFSNVDVYLAGSNLITISAEKKYLETNVGQSPQMRFFNLGLSAAF